jgi:hypothetical protein
VSEGFREGAVDGAAVTGDADGSGVGKVGSNVGTVGADVGNVGSLVGKVGSVEGS